MPGVPMVPPVVTVTMANVGNLTPNSEVKVNDVTVGSVRTIAFKDWKAQLTLGIEGGVQLPGGGDVPHRGHAE